MRCRRVIIMVLLLCYPIMVMAQRDLRTRQELDALVNPQLSHEAAGTLVAHERHRNIGNIAAEEPISVTFKLHNNTSQPIAVTEIRSSCSCLRVATKPCVVKAHGSMTIDAHLNVEGRKGAFRHNIFVYTALDEQHPTERLSIEGVVENDDIWLHLPESMGDLRLTRKEVTIVGCGEERIAVANASTRAMTLKALSTVDGLTLRTEPEVIEAGKEGDIIISYKPQERLVGDMETMLIIEGMNASPMDRVIKIRIKRER